MGFISRKIFPACGSICVCCPALRSRSRHPVKRYKKLLLEIFHKSENAPPNEKKIVKLCEYAAKNPFRIPKIAKYLEERCYKELRAEHIRAISIVTDVYDRLLYICNDHITYFATSLLNVVAELLENSRKDAIQILGCQILTRFIYSQVDGTYIHGIEKLVRKVCMLACVKGEERQKCCLRASSLQCLSAMVWFMTESSHIFLEFDEIVNATLDNYEKVTYNIENVGGEESAHNWVDGVIRCEGRGGSVTGNNTGSSCLIVQPHLEKKDPSSLTSEEKDSPEVWAQICIQRMVELAKESTTLRRVLEPMFLYFDCGQHWFSVHALAIKVLSYMSYLMETPGKQQLILASVIRHLDHKNTVHDPQLKTCIIQVATYLARQINSGRVLAQLGFVSDLCRHLRRSLQATTESMGEEELNFNILLQNSIEDCLLEIAKGIGDARPFFDMMALTLENLPHDPVAWATISSSIILARVISSAFSSSSGQQVFPESLLVQLLQVMLHPDVDARIGAHQIFSILLFPCFDQPRYDIASLQYGSIYQHSKWNSHSEPASASIASLLEKLLKGNGGDAKADKSCSNSSDGREKDVVGEGWRMGCGIKNFPNSLKLSSIIEKASGSTSLAEESSTVRLSEDEVTQLLSSFWIQANLPDNMPSNVVAIAQSFNLTLISLRSKNLNGSVLVRIFQLPLSLWNKSLDPTSVLSPACLRSTFVLSLGMSMFVSKIFDIPELTRIFKSLSLDDVDPFLGITGDHQVYLKSHADLRHYGSVADNRSAASVLFELRNKIHKLGSSIKDVLVENLASINEVYADDLATQLSQTFTPDEAFLIGPKSMLGLDYRKKFSHSKESQSFDGDFLCNSSVEDEVPVADFSRFVPKRTPSPAVPHLISVGHLLESALEVAGQVAGTSESSSPLPFNSMTSQCEALGTGSRTKLSNWLAHENNEKLLAESLSLEFPNNSRSPLDKITTVDGHAQTDALEQDPCLAMRLPPASPYDNFLKAAGC